MKNVIPLALILVVFLFAPAGQTAPAKTSKRSPVHPAITSIHEQVPSASTLPLTDTQFYEHLPVARVDVDGPDDAWGTVILLPQYHRLPESKEQDAVNDRAYLAQQELTRVLAALADAAPQIPVFVEGELIGPVNPQKVESYTQWHEDLDAFRDTGTQLVSLLDQHAFPTSLQQQTATAIDTLYTRTDRSLQLAGAPFVVDAKVDAHTPVRLYGVERPETLQASAEVVRNHLYAKDRLAQLTQEREPLAYDPETSSLSPTFLKVLSGTASTSTIEKTLSRVEKRAKKESLTDVETLVAALKRLSTSVERPKIITEMMSSKTPSPLRKENPYQHITSVQKMKRLVKDSNEKIDNVILKRRNEETADEVKNVLTQQPEKLGVLQFGKAHTEGLKTELMARGLRVITVTTDHVEQK